MLGSIRDNGRKPSAFSTVFREVTRQLQFCGAGTLTAKLWEHRERILTQHQAIREGFWEEVASEET